MSTNNVFGYCICHTILHLKYPQIRGFYLPSFHEGNIDGQVLLTLKSMTFPHLIIAPSFKSFANVLGQSLHKAYSHYRPSTL